MPEHLPYIDLELEFLLTFLVITERRIIRVEEKAIDLFGDYDRSMRRRVTRTVVVLNLLLLRNCTAWLALAWSAKPRTVGIEKTYSRKRGMLLTTKANTHRYLPLFLKRWRLLSAYTAITVPESF
tara:strand:- start:20048 stop:20422 length:375 start_codon:yes stop_codon:yes gene_type:complete